MKFELRFKEKGKKTPIYYIIRKNRKNHRIFLKYPTGISIISDNWNHRTQQVREISGIPFESYNRTLTKIKRTAADIFSHNDYYELTSDIVRKKIDIALKRKNKDDENFFGYYQNYIDKHKPKRGTRFALNYGTTLNLLKTFSPNLTWNKIDYSFYLKLISHLEQKGASKNYIAKHIKCIKIVLAEAAKDNQPVNPSFRDFKATEEKVYNIYLSEEELENIYKLKDFKPLHLEKARDLFLIGCYTGMRAENYLNIDPKVNINLKKNVITAIVNKKGPRITIPIHWIIREIIEKYNGLPESISQQKLNKYIKKVGEIAELNETVISVKEIGGKRTQIVKKKWEMITTHTARRSMITNLYKRQVPLSYIMQISGHKTESQCLRYIKAGYEEINAKVAALDFWNKK